MARRRRFLNGEPARPHKVFRELTDSLLNQFHKLADAAARKFKPPAIELSTVFDLCVNKADHDYLRRAWDNCRLRVQPSWREQISCMLPGDGILQHLTLKFSFLKEAQNDFMLQPDYAYNPKAPIDTAPAETVAVMVDYVQAWADLMLDISLAKAVFTSLNDMYRDRTREQLRYVFPAVVPLLRRVANDVSNDEKIRTEALKWATKLANPLPSHNWGPPPEWRPAIIKANEVVAMVSLYDNTPYTHPPHCADIALVVNNDAGEITHPLWPHRPVELLGVDPS